MKLYINEVLLGDLPTIHRKEGRIVGEMEIPCKVTVVHDEEDNKTDPDMMRTMSNVYSFSGDKGEFTAMVDASDGTWRVGQNGTTSWYRTGMEEDAAVELAFTLAYTGTQELQ